ncbi:MAG: TetR/AcrR family transcriptional regulator [Myxococcaceae bacterium]
MTTIPEATTRVRTANSATTRRILTAAAGLFAERHYHQVRMDDVAARAGVAKGTLYGHFKDKEDLYLALILDGLTRLLRRFEESLSGLDSPEAKVHAFTRESVQFFGRHEYFLELTERAEVLREGESGAPLREVRARLLDLLAGVMRELAATRRYVVEYPELAVLVLLGMTREVIRFYPRPWSEELAERIARHFLRGLGPTD